MENGTYAKDDDLNHIQDKLIRSNASPLNSESVTTFTPHEDDEVIDCNTSGIPSTWLPFFWQSVEQVHRPQLTSCHPADHQA